MLDHVTLGVSDIERSMQFYDRALRPLGIARLYAEDERSAGYGIKPKAFFWIGIRPSSQTGAHIAFTANDRATVDRFYAEAIQGLVAHMRTEQQMIREWADGQGEQNREIKRLLERIARQPEKS